MSVEAGSLHWTFGAKDGGFESAVDRARIVMGGLAATAAKVALIGAGIFTVAMGSAAVALGFAAKEAAEAEKNLFQLDAVMRATGNSAGFTTRALQEWAADIQRTTEFSDDAAIAMFRVLSTFKNVKGDVFTGAAQAAMDFAAALGGDLNSAAEMLGKALNNPLRGMQLLERQGISFTDTQRRMIEEAVAQNRVMDAQRIILQAVSGIVGGAAAGSVDTLSGAWANLKNQLGEVAETVGTAVVPILKSVVEWIRGNMPLIESVATWITGTIQNVAGEWLPWLWEQTKTLAMKVAEYMAVASAVWENFDMAVASVALGVAASVSEMWDRVNWFADNFVSGPLITIYDNVKSIVQGVSQIVMNLVDTVKSLFSAMWDFITSGGETWSLSMKDILDDVNVELRAFDPTAAFEESDRTKGLKGLRDAMDVGLGEAINRKVKEYQDALSRILNPGSPAAPGAAPAPNAPFVPPTAEDIRGDEGEKEKKQVEAIAEGFQSSGLLESIDKLQMGILNQRSPEVEAIEMLRKDMQAWLSGTSDQGDEQVKTSEQIAENTRETNALLSRGIAAVAVA